jgi:hypothetical protein
MKLLRRVSAVIVAALCVVLIPAVEPAGAISRSTAIADAARYGPARGYHVGLAVFDTARGRIYGGGDATGAFASESVVKVMIANRLLVQGRMRGTTARRAYKMITQSDDAIATSFYPSVGGDGLILWIKRRYKVWDLGSRPSAPGWWGNTHITPRGLVRYYARVRRDARAGPWLLNAMHHATPYGSDGTYQFFGLPQATTGAAIKQGWGDDYENGPANADFNTTGFVNDNRYAVAILGRGPIGSYGAAIRNMLTRTAQLLLPGGHFPDPVPGVGSLSTSRGKTAGGLRIAVHGSDFSHVTRVTFGAIAGTNVTVDRANLLHVTTPAHRAGAFPVRVVTTHGTSVATARFTFIAPPSLAALAPTSGPAAGGTTVSITGTRFTGASAVLFGGTAGTGLHVTSATTLTVVAPPGVPGPADVRVVTPYGTSPIVPAAVFGYEP